MRRLKSLRLASKRFNAYLHKYSSMLTERAPSQQLLLLLGVLSPLLLLLLLEECRRVLVCCSKPVSQTSVEIC
jgi:hypothetical protein